MSFGRWSGARPLIGLTACFLVATAGCGSDDDAPEPPSGPTADLSEELVGGNGPFIGSGSLGVDFPGYLVAEYVAAGTATSYRAVGEQSADGRWTFAADGAADYRTRVLIRYPEDRDDFSGTLIVEWMNVSGGVDANPNFDSVVEEILRQGHAWAGVSAQLIGVEGGPVLVVAPGAEDLAGKGLKGIDPVRYGTLSHPGDGFSFDILTQVARALSAGPDAIGGLRPDIVLAAGESQSAIALVTYYNGVQPTENVFDGFFVHSRGSFALPLVGPGEYADLAGAIGGEPVILRTDLEAPVIELQAEGDVTGLLNSRLVRQPDSETFRLWEVAGTAHADARLVGIIADFIDCGVPINHGPLHLTAKAALHHLDNWVRGDEAPPTAPLLETEGEPAEIARDADGIALGGIRTPPVDVPLDVHSGEPGPNPSLLCLLLGSTTPLPDARLSELYPSADDYTLRFANAAGTAFDGGYVLEDDRDALFEYFEPERVP